MKKVLLVVGLAVISLQIYNYKNVQVENNKEVVIKVVDEPKKNNESFSVVTKKILNIDVTNKHVTLLGPVTEESITKTIKDLKEKTKSNKEVYLLIDSPGGSVVDGSQLISFMEASPVPIHTVCLKLCASMGFVIHQYGKTRLAVDRSFLMAHPASGGTRGQLDNMISQLNALQRYVTKSNNYIASRSGKTLAEFKELWAFEMWKDAEDSKELGFLDSIVFLTGDFELQRPVDIFEHHNKKLDLTW